MKLWLSSISLLLFFNVASAQFTDDFADGDFSSNPAWQGETGKFIVNTSMQLQLSDPVPSDVGHLSTAVSIADSTVWIFYVKLNFSPSVNNLLRVYLQSNQADLEGSLQGYFIQLGVNGSTDGIDLYKQNGTSTSLVAQGIAGHAAVNPEARIKVVRDDAGNWIVYSDLSGGTGFATEGSGFDDSYLQGQYLGVYCKHTSTNAAKFYFDDFWVNPISIDTLKPEISSIEAISATELSVHFSESLEQTAAENISNYVADLYGSPLSAQLDLSDQALVHLVFPSLFQSGTIDTLRVSNIADLNGNIQNDNAFPFMYYTAGYGDIGINEIMADPSPTVGLPDQEFVEILNNTGFNLNLANWTFSDASSTITLPAVILKADSLAIFCDPSNTGLFATYGRVIALSGFPTLNNSGDDLSLHDPTGQLISRVTYSDSWYRDEVKKAGGWSLEQIDPLASCQGASNWVASVNPKGGTPGKPNSVLGIFPDTSGPGVLYATVSGKQVMVYFSEDLDTATSLDSSNYLIDQGIGYPTGVKLFGNHRDIIQLTLPTKADTGVLYTLTMQKLSDCAGNWLMPPDTVIFATTFPIKAGDLVLNEILFNPQSGGVDYLELYNLSDKVLDIRNLEYAEIDPVMGNVLGQAQLSGKPYLMLPGDYFAITSDKSITLFDYYTTAPEHVIELTSLPNWADAEGIVRIQSDSLHVLDELHYYSSWHFPLIDDENGVSLERIHPAEKTQDAGNWHSAASSVGYGTPAYLNSQYGDVFITSTSFSLEPEIFSPDQDGYHDYLTIHYQFDEAGNMLTIHVFDPQGRMVKTLANNELVGQSGSFTWDGSDMTGNMANTGIYIISTETFNLKGQTSHFRLKCVLAK